MKTVTFYTVVLSVILGFGACATAKMDKELAKQIRSDAAPENRQCQSGRIDSKRAECRRLLQ